MMDAMCIHHEALRYYRERAGMSQADLARASGLQQAQISNWEQGRYQPRDMEAALEALAGALGVSAVDLCGPPPDEPLDDRIPEDVMEGPVDRFVAWLAEHIYDDWEDFMAWSRARGNG